MKKYFFILIVIASVILAGCISKEQTVRTPAGDVNIKEGTGPDWCKKGTQIKTDINQEGGGTYTVKGITTYQGKEVCEAEIVTGTNTMVQYYTNDNSFYAVVLKDKNGKIIQEYNVTNPITNK